MIITDIPNIIGSILILIIDIFMAFVLLIMQFKYLKDY